MYFMLYDVIINNILSMFGCYIINIEFIDYIKYEFKSDSGGKYERTI